MYATSAQAMIALDRAMLPIRTAGTDYHGKSVVALSSALDAAMAPTWRVARPSMTAEMVDYLADMEDAAQAHRVLVAITGGR